MEHRRSADDSVVRTAECTRHAQFDPQVRVRGTELQDQRRAVGSQWEVLLRVRIGGSGPRQFFRGSAVFPGVNCCSVSGRIASLLDLFHFLADLQFPFMTDVCNTCMGYVNGFSYTATVSNCIHNATRPYISYSRFQNPVSTRSAQCMIPLNQMPTTH